jgi:hypothetical protein
VTAKSTDYLGIGTVTNRFFGSKKGLNMEPAIGFICQFGRPPWFRYRYQTVFWTEYSVQEERVFEPTCRFGRALQARYRYQSVFRIEYTIVGEPALGLACQFNRLIRVRYRYQSVFRIDADSYGGLAETDLTILRGAELARPGQDRSGLGRRQRPPETAPAVAWALLGFGCIKNGIDGDGKRRPKDRVRRFASSVAAGFLVGVAG